MSTTLDKVERTLSLFVLYKRYMEKKINGEDCEKEKHACWDKGISVPSPNMLGAFSEMEEYLDEAYEDLSSLPWSLSVESARLIVKDFYKQLYNLRMRYTGGWG